LLQTFLSGAFRETEESVTPIAPKAPFSAVAEAEMQELGIAIAAYFI